jgi:hypothetical protein
MKGWRNDGGRPQIGTGMYNLYTETQNKMLCFCRVTPSESALEGPGENWEVESGRPPTGGPVRSDRKEHRSSLVSRSYGPRSITGRTKRDIGCQLSRLPTVTASPSPGLGPQPGGPGPLRPGCAAAPPTGPGHARHFGNWTPADRAAAATRPVPGARPGAAACQWPADIHP